MQNNYRKRVGQFGEQLAREYLVKYGYQIIAGNVKTSYQEIDIIAKQNNLLIFIEVKTRTSTKFGQADEAVTSQKVSNLKKAIENYIYENNLELDNARADLIAVDIDKSKKIAKIKHYKNIV